MNNELFPDIPFPESEGELHARLVEQRNLRQRNIAQDTGDRIEKYRQAMVNLDFLLDVYGVYVNIEVTPVSSASHHPL